MFRIDTYIQENVKILKYNFILRIFWTYPHVDNHVNRDEKKWAFPMKLWRGDQTNSLAWQCLQLVMDTLKGRVRRLEKITSQEKISIET